MGQRQDGGKSERPARMMSLGSAPSGREKRIGELLVEAGLITSGELERALSVQAKEGGRTAEVLMAQGSLEPDKFLTFLARQPGVASIDLSNYEIPRDLVSLVPREFAVAHELMPIDKLGRLMTVAMVCPLDARTIGELEQTTGLKVKPMLCSADDLREAIKRYYPPTPAKPAPQEKPPAAPAVYELDGLKSPIKLRNVAKLVRSIDTLPALPETVHKTREAVANPDTSVRDLAKIISGDPAVAAKVLSVANSAAYGFAQRVHDVTHAVSLMGLREVYSIVLSLAVFDALKGSKTFDYPSFWSQAMRCGAASRVIIRMSNRRAAVGLFSAGLLHDIGRLALAEVVPELYAKVPTDLVGRDLVQAEEELIGISHNEAGYELAQHWELPDDIAEAIRFHNMPEAASNHRETVGLVSLAALMVLGELAGKGSEDSFLDGREEVLDIVGICADDVQAMYQEFLGTESNGAGD